MTTEIHTEIEIDAPASKVWEILTDRPAWSEWNPVLVRLDGPLRVGAKHELGIRIGRRVLPLKVRVVEFDAPRALAWKGGASLVFKAHHGFRIEATSEDRCRFVHYERFTGALTRLVGGYLRRTLTPGYAKMNRALKARAEATKPYGQER